MAGQSANDEREKGKLEEEFRNIEVDLERLHFDEQSEAQESEELQKLHVEKQNLTDAVGSFEARFVRLLHLTLFGTLSAFQDQFL
uniref:Uncharacterized protein n=1 Tax=Parascaris equorum TaxID=6256 RepID=A0A914RD10_PAREQ